MLVRILGSAAGGGFPQWNCNCPGCQFVREGKGVAHQRTQSSLAVRGTEGSWYLINASPDVRLQLERLRDTVPTSIRSNPIAGVLLTDAEIDHTAGLMILRESAEPLAIYGTNSVRKALTEGFSILRVLKDYCGVIWSNIEPGYTVNLNSDDSSSLEIEVFSLKSKPPKYMRSDVGVDENYDGSVVGFTFRDRISGGVVTYAPALYEFSDSILERLDKSDCILVDGTFWQNDELVKLRMSTRTSEAMGHLPLLGDNGSLNHLAKLSSKRKIFTHINNSNPILIPNSAERKIVEAAGIEVADDGLTIEF